MAAPIRICFRRFFDNSMKIPKQNAYISNLSNSRRFMSSMRELKKFYKNASIVMSDGWFEINLDKRKLKTPSGQIFRTPNESLALAVATEWNSQEKVIKRHNMHLTSLCNTALDNPFQKSREILTESIIHFLETDTICYRLKEPEDLYQLQTQNWDPVIKWATHRFGIEVKPTYTMSLPEVSAESKSIIKRHLLSYSDWALFGYSYAVESIKSLLLIMALVEKCISVEEAVKLSRLEQEYQSEKWGNVEWHHDLDQLDLQSRLAAAALFIHWCSENTTIFHKASLERQNICAV